MLGAAAKTRAGAAVSVLALAVTGRGLVDPSEPVLRVDDEGFARGRAAFETLRVYRGRPFRLASHLRRLALSAERIGLPEPELGEIERLVELALEDGRASDAVLRIFWSAGPPNGSPGGYVLVSEIPAWIEAVRARGQTLVSLLCPPRSAPWLLPGTKSVSYAVNMAADAEAKRLGADDAVFVDAEGILLEGPVTNVWWREGPTLLTPSLELGILAGETRAALLEIAPSLGYALEEGSYPLERLVAADEAFTSSSVREIVPVVRIDGHTISRGAAATQLQEALRRVAGAGS